MAKSGSGKRVSRYAGKFWGVTASTLEAFRTSIERGRDRAAAFYLLSTLLLESRWNFHDPGADFSLTRRKIQEATAWSHNEIAKYIGVLTSVGILNVKGMVGRASVYWLNCDALGLIRKGDRSKKKSLRPYIGDFWGMTAPLRCRITERIPEGQERRGKQRSKCLWLLANMLLYSNWNRNRPGDPFQISLRDLALLTGWHFQTVSRHRDILIEARFLDVDYGGGRGVAGSYVLNLGLAAIRGPANDPTANIFEDREAKEKS
jgi:hypothetical protein